MGRLDTRFNLQEFLADMRREQRDDHQALSDRVGTILQTLSGHDMRLRSLERLRRSARWATSVVIVGVLTFLLDLLTTHFPQIVSTIIGR